MTGKNQIIRAVDGKTSEASADDTASLETGAVSTDFETTEAGTESGYEEEDYASPAPSRFGLIAGIVGVLAVLGWTALYAWAMQDQLLNASSAAPSEWVRWIIDWSVPVLLVCVIWLLAMRNSTREASRFAASAAMLSHESAQLEDRLTVVNRELSLAREFLASQSRDLEALGRIAAERLSTNAEELQSLIKTNGAQVEAIGTTSESALSNMTRLRDDLPVIANSARDVNNQVGSTGRTAREQLEKLIAGFERLNQFGTASENQVQGFTARIGETLGAFETQLGRIEKTITERYSALQSKAESYRGSISAMEAEALGAMKERVSLLQAETQAIGENIRQAEEKGLDQVLASKTRWEQEMVDMVERLTALDLQAMQASQSRIKELNEEAGRFDDKLKQRDVLFMEEMTRRQDDFSTREAQATETLSQRLTDLDDMLAEKREAQVADAEKLVAQSAEMAGQLDKLSVMMTSVEALGTSARSSLTEGLEELGKTLEAKKASLAETESSLAALTEASVRMLEIIQSGAQHSRDDLPEAINTASEALGKIEERSTLLTGAMLTMGEKGEDLSSYLIQTKEGIEQADASLASLQEKVAERSDDALAKLNGLHGGLERLAKDSEVFAGETQEALIASIAKLEEATRATITTLEKGAQSEVTGLAERLSAEAVTAMERALRNDSAETIGKLEQAAAHASGVGREATRQLRDQLVRVNELTGNLEQRIERARELAEEQVDNDFARRMALITDTLNSSAIDISAAISTEVSDTSWNAYLKGDRGIFTRRAVRLLDNGEARAIADLYQNDEAFHANVSRYIHDFEAMLRSMLSTRDGNALSVTILGSDMGKLYVALAQGIERFRK